MSDIRWVAVKPMAPFGGRDVIVAEFTAPNRKAAETEYARRVARRELEAGLLVLSRLQFDDVDKSVTQSRAELQRPPRPYSRGK